MNEDRDLDRLLDAWFADGPAMAHDRVVDGVASRISRQRQLPAWRLRSWRFPAMSSPLKLVLIGAALVAALAAGAVIVGGGPNGLGVMTPTPTPVPPPLPNGNLAPGAYTAHPVTGMTWTITVPDGWTGSDDWFLSYDLAPDTHAVSVGGPTENENAPADSCAAAGTAPAASVDAFVAAVQARDDWTVSAPVDVAVGGYSGSRIDLEVPADATCSNGHDYMVLAMPDGTGYRAHGQDRLFRLWILDVDGRPIVIFRSRYPNAPADRVAEGDAIVETSVIRP
ncbi:MAG TPA: hypothetical protein VGK16_07065 [Candidatus Limnocylindrales bacterium]|jgi:hypothetical protein